MSVHLSAKQGEIAEIVLLPGDPLRAKHVAEQFLEDVYCYNEVRGMLGFTGTFQGVRVSVQGTGMGMPSAGIYIHELIQDYGARKLVRIGTCGGLKHEVDVRDIVIAQAACTDSAMFNFLEGRVRFAPIGDFQLIRQAYEIGLQEGMTMHVGNVFSTDTFYAEDRTVTERLAEYGVLAVEMETAALYSLAAKFKVQALSLLTVSDHLLTGEETTAMERQTTFNQMIEMALKAVL